MQKAFKMNKQQQSISGQVPRSGIPPLASATFCAAIATPPNEAFDWRICIGMRGFLGRCLDDVSESLRKKLLPVFHEHHNQPAPFRIVLEQSNPSEGIHRLRLVTFGSQSEWIAACFADLWRGTSGYIRSGDADIPFQTLQIEEPEYGALYLPSARNPQEAEDSTGWELLSASPFFSRTNAEVLFTRGRWTNLLAIRFADLMGYRRDQLQESLPAIVAPSQSESAIYGLALGGRRRAQRGHIYRALFSPAAGADTLACLELLQCLGLGRHCAYGAGAFSLQKIADHVF